MHGVGDVVSTYGNSNKQYPIETAIGECDQDNSIRQNKASQMRHARTVIRRSSTEPNGISSISSTNPDNSDASTHMCQATSLEDFRDDSCLTPYDRLRRDLSQDQRVIKEITFGKRISFYRIRGELGSGNFSQVKLGIHTLTKGELISNSWLIKVNLK